MNARPALGLFCTLVMLSGCNTYTTTRVPETGSARGYPFVFQKPYLAVVTYTDDTKSLHTLIVPTLYAVDSERAALGATKTEFENTPDGFALKTKTDLDQKIPENLQALTELLKQLGVTVGTKVVAPGTAGLKFEPELSAEKQIKALDLKPL